MPTQATIDASTTAILAAADQASRKSLGKRRRHRTKEQRNLTIFKKVVIEHCTHEEAAHCFQLRRSRVSQIVKKIRHQLAGAAADDPEINDQLAQDRLERNLERFRLEYALAAAAQAMRRNPTSLQTHRAGAREKGGHKEGWSETVTRDTPPNVQTIKTFLRVSQDLGQLRQRAAEAQPPPAKLSYEELFRAIYDVLFDWIYNRLQFEDDPPSNEFIEMVSQFSQNIFIWTLRRKQGLSRASLGPTRRLQHLLSRPLQPPLALTNPRQILTSR